MRRQASPKSKATASFSDIALTNARKSKSTLLAFIRGAIRRSTPSGSKRHFHVVSCYFDPDALDRLVQEVRQELTAAKAALVGVTVSVDAGDWIQHQLSTDDLQRRIAKAANLSKSHVTFRPIRFPSQLLHAKSYAAIGPQPYKEGFVVVTSGNLTEQGLGLIDGSNREIAFATNDQSSLAAFEAISKSLADSEVTEKAALKQDFFLRALALFGSGVFYHRWSGALGAEARFALTLTQRGKELRKQDAAAFPGYERDSDSISRDPLGLGQVLEKSLTKPFPKAFWRSFSVDTVFGRWVPEPIAELVDEKLDDDVTPYIEAISAKTAPNKLSAVSAKLEQETKEYSRKKLVRQQPAAVQTWRRRVEDFRKNRQLIQLRVLPYTRVPDLLHAEMRADVIKAARELAGHLAMKQARSAKRVVAEFLQGTMTLDELHDEWDAMKRLAAKKL